MSQYLCFYVKHPDSKKIVMINCYSRNSYIYQVAVQSITIPIESLRCLSTSNLDTIKSYIKADIKLKNKSINEIDNQINFLSQTQAPARELLEIYTERRAEKAEYKRTLEKYIYALHFYDILFDIVNSNIEEYTDGPSVLYCGIECYNPTIDDIVELQPFNFLKIYYFYGIINIENEKGILL